MTLQPCHYSKRGVEKSCTDLFIRLYQDLKARSIKMTLKITFIHKAHWVKDGDETVDWEIQNAKDGLSLLRSSGIKVEAMEKHDWMELLDIANLDLEIDNVYQTESPRCKLDNFIADFLLSLP